MTNANGVAVFKTAYPGWYNGRATHVHIKVHIGSSLSTIGGAIYAKGGHVSHTGQLFFDDNLTDRVATVYPYSTHTIQRVRNNDDQDYVDSNGSNMLISTKYLGNDFSKDILSGVIIPLHRVSATKRHDTPRNQLPK